jgi:multiple sugar transport system ATP-binding protein
VGGFIGNPPMNFIEGQVRAENGSVQVHLGDFAIKPPEFVASTLKAYDGQPVLIGIRAENIETFTTPADGAMKVQVLVVEPLGSQNLLTIKIGDSIVKVATHPDFPAAPDKDIWLRFPIDKVRWLNRDSQKALALA